MKSLAHWRPYLGWTKVPFIIRTDHANLQYWKSPQNLNRRTARWHADLQEYDFQLEYILGKTNIPSDFLSRPPLADQGKTDNQSIIVIPPEKCRTSTMKDNKIQVPPILEVKRGIMNLYHDHPLAGHPGRDETIRKVQERYSWPHMTQWIAEYVKGCAICQQNKILTHKARIPLFQIPTTNDAKPFQRVAMDLITGLPKQGDKDAILTIVNQGCSRAAMFLPCNTTITGPQIAQLYLNHVYKWFGLPEKIISDRDPSFTSHFGSALTKKLNIQQNLSTAFHPQTNGLSERKNQWVEQYLRIITSLHPEDWTNWISIATIVHNNRRNATTKLSPNQIILGYEPMLTPETRIKTTNQMAEDRIKTMLQRHQEAIQALNDIARNPKGIPVRFQKGDQVWLEATNLCLPFQASKLNPKRYGPFKVQKVLSPVAYQLELPNTWRIHNTFHSSLLLPYHETTIHGPNFSRPPPDLIDDKEEQEIEHILAHWYFSKKKRLQYLIKWKGFPESENKWVSPLHMHAPDLIQQYHRRNPPPTIKAALFNREKDIASSTTLIEPPPNPNKPCLTCPSTHPSPQSPQPLLAQRPTSQAPHPLNRSWFHCPAQCSMTRNGSHSQCHPTPPLWPLNSTIRTCLTSPSHAILPRGLLRLSRGGKTSTKERSYALRTTLEVSRIASSTMRRLLPLPQTGMSKIFTTLTSSSPSAMGSFSPQNGSNSSKKDTLPCTQQTTDHPLPQPLVSSMPNQTPALPSQLSPCQPGTRPFLWDLQLPSTPTVAPSLTPSNGEREQMSPILGRLMKRSSKPALDSGPSKRSSKTFVSVDPLSRCASKWPAPPSKPRALNHWRWGTMSPFAVGPGRRPPRSMIEDDHPKWGSNVTGTWSKKWSQGKFGNRAIEVRNFSGSGTGLGSGAVPPGMSL